MAKIPSTTRVWEIIPGFMAWSLILFPLWGSFLVPRLVAYFVIAFLLYWLFQSFKSATLAIIGYFRIQTAKNINWRQRFNDDFRASWLRYADISHVVFVVSYKEPISVIDMAIGSIAGQLDIDLHKIHLVLAQEQRAGRDNNQQTEKYFSAKYGHLFGSLTFTEHPGNVPGETVGKHSNEAYAAKYFKKHFFDNHILTIDNCTLTTCDVDTIFNSRYFSALTYFFASDPQRYFRFWQTPIFWHHNINQVPFPIRIIGTIGNSLHIANIQEPDGLFFNYSCYSASYRLIDSAGYWDPNMIPEDWHIFLQTFFASGGKTSVNAIFLPTIVDAPTGNGFFDALKNRYQQCLRHAWGAIDIPYAIEQSIKHTEIPLLTRFLRVAKLFETHLIWSSNWFILTLGTSLPVILNPNFFHTAIGFNLPRISNVILTICLFPLAVIIFLDWKLRPNDQRQGFRAFIINLLQWPFMPVATLTMSVIPGLHSHTRLMLGKGLEYKTTIKK